MKFYRHKLTEKEYTALQNIYPLLFSKDFESNILASGLLKEEFPKCYLKLKGIICNGKSLVHINFLSHCEISQLGGYKYIGNLSITRQAVKTLLETGYLLLC